ncbi:thiol-disulfide isomerase/thioredoxin [Nonlabens dokdonensis]|uniref:Thiol-disulfide isomerase/thioredoxin n=2 Tax=Nonlabens dokdonensis TaxID=328515 RepID=A0ABX5PZ19_9FLAO|nr:thioredoxin family protein [Nonlabens dokdonensis]AGC77170.1 putative thioredoxin family protein [Nonlabens dokdonensis DSW-6]PZX41128.1 thiol-disulfide isomerase/thioredoxin [Nonlabens dokdonensis]
MKKIIIIIAAVIVTACGSQKATTTKTNTSTSSTTVQKTREIAEVDGTIEASSNYVKDASGNLSGKVDKDAFMQEPFSSWFNSRMASYKADPETIEDLKVALKDVEIRAYMGTWCGDSKRETPQFYNILEAAYYDMDNLTMITVDRSKKKPVALVSDYNIIRVPTFIFYRNGTEIGRYVERPRESLEKDMLKIVTGQPYKHSYEN